MKSAFAPDPAQTVESAVKYMVNYNQSFTVYASYGASQARCKNPITTGTVCLGNWPICYNSKYGSLTSIFHVISNSGNKRWLTWLYTKSPWKDVLPKNERIINGLNVNSDEFRIKYGTFLHVDDFDSVERTHFFSLCKAMRLGWNEYAPHTKVFHLLQDKGVDDLTAFTVSRFMRSDSNLSKFVPHVIHGGHGHIVSDRIVIKNGFENGFLKSPNRVSKNSISYLGCDSVMYPSSGYAVRPTPTLGSPTGISYLTEHVKSFSPVANTTGLFAGLGSKSRIASSVDIKGLMEIVEREKELIHACK